MLCTCLHSLLPCTFHSTQKIESSAIVSDGDTAGPLFGYLPSMVWLALKYWISPPPMLLGALQATLMVSSQPTHGYMVLVCVPSITHMPAIIASD